MRNKYATRLMHTAMLTLLPVAINAQEVRVEVPSSFNPVGSGARALGLGGSFIAMADDATAASWNPGALTQLRQTEVALVYSYTDRTEDNTFGTNPEANGEQSVSQSDLNYFAASMPCAASKCGKNMVFSLNYQRLYDLNRSWQFGLNADDASQQIESVITSDYVQTGSLFATGLAYGVQLTDTLSVGITLNFWEDALQDNDWQQDYIIEREGVGGGIPFTARQARQLAYDFSGFNFNIGALWDVYQKGEQKVTLGFVYKSELDGDLTVDRSLTTFNQFRVSEVFDGQQDVTIEDRLSQQDESEFILPKSFGLGVAYQWNDQLTTSLDVYKTDWSSFVLRNANGVETSPLSGRNISEFRPEDTTQVRAGVEYRIINQGAAANYIIPLRAGLFLDPAPADNGTDDFYGLSVGGGIAYEHLVFDIAYQYRWSDGDIGGSALSALNFSQQVQEHTLYGSVFYRF